MSGRGRGAAGGIVRIVLLAAALFGSATAAAHARCSDATIDAYRAKIAGAERLEKSAPRVAEIEFRSIYRDLTYCGDTERQDARLLIIGLLRERIETDVAVGFAMQGRYSDARDLLRTVNRRLDNFTRELHGDREGQALIVPYRTAARRADAVIHRAQGLASMKAAGDDPLRALIPSKRSGSAYLPNSPKPNAAAVESATCAQPNAAASVIHVVQPDVPPMAQQQGISGVVQVVVSLNEFSEVVGTRIQASPSAILNSAALSAARQSTFQTEIRGCKPIASDFTFSVDFTSK